MASQYASPHAGPIAISISSPSHQAFRLLHVIYMIAPVIAGIDKVFNILTNWEKYLAPSVSNLLPVAPLTFMSMVGIVEVAAGIIVAVKPRLGGYIVAAWLLAIIINLLMVGGYYDVAFRDLGLCCGALALSRLAVEHSS